SRLPVPARLDQLWDDIREELRRATPDFKFHIWLEPLELAGLDGRTLYVADSAVRTIWAYDYAPEGPLSRQRVFVQTEGFGSGPDGATVDAQGFLWTVLTRIGKITRFAPDGRLDRMVELPATHPTSLCFGGPQFEVAYVTSISRSTHLAGLLPQDGGLFALSGTPAAGMPAHRFAD
ncbi:MAG TPA: SMP-30/gluconolactonase/LRE family protein, partial [Xanthomonadaceae bacterium]|nr:SMP-30/gluconolactonase/LRE family protein [Xanthomonadaceae bacterium]